MSKLVICLCPLTVGHFMNGTEAVQMLSYSLLSVFLTTAGADINRGFVLRS
jgi:hypothetical protein